MSRSTSLQEQYRVLEKGTLLLKVRNKGMRGVQVYRRTFTLDTKNMEIRFTPHRDSASSLSCTFKGDHKNNMTAVFLCSIYLTLSAAQNTSTLVNINNEFSK